MMYASRCLATQTQTKIKQVPNWVSKRLWTRGLSQRGRPRNFDDTCVTFVVASLSCLACHFPLLTKLPAFMSSLRLYLFPFMSHFPLLKKSLAICLRSLFFSSLILIPFSYLVLLSSLFLIVQVCGFSSLLPSLLLPRRSLRRPRVTLDKRAPLSNLPAFLHDSNRGVMRILDSGPQRLTTSERVDGVGIDLWWMNGWQGLWT